MSWKTYIFLILALGVNRLSHSQAIRLDTLPLVEVHQNRNPESNPGLRITYFNEKEPSFRQGLSLAEILSRSGQLFIRSGSNGTLASPSLRGLGPVHTALIWNGFNIQSSMNGQADFNLISPLLFDNFALQPGSGNALWGSSAAGGSLHIGSTDSCSQISTSQSIGSWNMYTGAVRAALVRKKFSLSFRAFRQYALNNYLYRDPSTPNHTLRNQANAELRHFATMGKLNLSTGKNQLLTLTVWSQEGQRQIPPLVTTPLAFANQYDNLLRSAVNWSVETGNSTIQIRSAYFREKIHYRDSLANLYAQNTAHSFVQEAEWEYSFHPNHRLQAGLNYTRHLANVDGYHSPNRQQRRFAVFASSHNQWFGRRLHSLVAIRQEWYDHQIAPLIPSLSGSWHFSQTLSIRAQIAGLFRIPTLNDLYWIPGGNPALKPEHGISTELAVDKQVQLNRISIKSSLGAFANSIKNRILWEPGNSFWQPSNLNRVLSRGTELNIDVQVKQAIAVWKLVLNAQYLVSGESKTGQTFWDKPEFQLIYTPSLLASGLIEYRINKLAVYVQGSFTGSRYTRSDNTHSLPAYFIADAGIQYEFPFKETPIYLFLTCRNLLNEAYEITIWRPMPLRSWLAGIQFQIINPNKNKS